MQIQVQIEVQVQFQKKNMLSIFRGCQNRLLGWGLEFFIRGARSYKYNLGFGFFIGGVLGPSYF